MKYELIGALIFQICFAGIWGLTKYGFHPKALCHLLIAAPIGFVAMFILILVKRKLQGT